MSDKEIQELLEKLKKQSLELSIRIDKQLKTNQKKAKKKEEEEEKQPEMMHVFLSGGPQRHSFTYKSHIFKNKKILASLLEKVPGVLFYASGSRKLVNVILVPQGVSDASDSAKKKARPDAQVLSLDAFVDDYFSPSQRRAFQVHLETV